MPRRGNVAKRDVLPDPMYNSKLVTRLINNIMYDGKKGVAQKIVYEAAPAFGLLAPYLERACIRFATPCASSVPRMMW